MKYEYTSHAKCILAGEHAVLRGHPALVFPLKSLQLKLSYQENNDPINADYVGPYGESMLLMFWGTLKKAFEMIDKDLNQVKGQLLIENHIPLCAGLGFSAALCIVIGRWFVTKSWLNERDLFDFARNLEDKFHQESSGIDIAGAMSSTGVLYTRNVPPTKIVFNWQPKLYVSYTHQISVTAEAVKKVKDLFTHDRLLANRIDLDMEESVLLAREAFQLTQETGITLLVGAMDKACSCFERWDLMPHKVQNHIDKLREQGAVAAKPTGAGGGGHVLSLWQDDPQDVPFELYRVL